MLLISTEGRRDAEIKSNHCLYYIFSFSLFTQEKMVFNAKLIHNLQCELFINKKQALTGKANQQLS